MGSAKVFFAEEMEGTGAGLAAPHIGGKVKNFFAKGLLPPAIGLAVLRGEQHDRLRQVGLLENRIVVRELEGGGGAVLSLKRQQGIPLAAQVLLDQRT